MYLPSMTTALSRDLKAALLDYSSMIALPISQHISFDLRHWTSILEHYNPFTQQHLIPDTLVPLSAPHKPQYFKAFSTVDFQAFPYLSILHDLWEHSPSATRNTKHPYSPFGISQASILRGSQHGRPTSFPIPPRSRHSGILRSCIYPNHIHRRSHCPIHFLCLISFEMHDSREMEHTIPSNTLVLLAFCLHGTDR